MLFTTTNLYFSMMLRYNTILLRYNTAILLCFWAITFLLGLDSKSLASMGFGNWSSLAYQDTTDQALRFSRRKRGGEGS